MSNAARAVEIKIGDFIALNNIEVRKVIDPVFLNNTPMYNESICRQFEICDSGFSQTIQYLNFTEEPIRIMLRDHSEFTLMPSPMYSAYAPKRGLYIRRSVILRHRAEMSFNVRGSLGEETDEGTAIKQVIKEYKERRTPTDYISKLHDPKIEYFYPPEKIFRNDGVGVYINEFDIVVCHAGMRMDAAHPRYKVMDEVSGVQNIAKSSESKHSGFTFFINDIEMGYAPRYLAIGEITIKIEVIHDAELAEGFYIKTYTEFIAGKGETAADFKRITIEHADKQFLLGSTPEEAKMRSQQEMLKLKRREIELKEEEIRANQEMHNAKLSIETKKLSISEVQHTFHERRQTAEEVQHSYTKRRDFRVEILDWLKFLFSAIGTLFMIKGALT